VRRVWTISFVNKYSFELAVILIELIACLLVALTLIKLFGPRLGNVLAAEPHPNRQHTIKLVTLPPIQPHSAIDEPAGLYITVTELQASTPEPISRDILQNNWPDTSTPSLDTPLAGWPVRGEVTQGFGCSLFYTGLPGSDCPTDQPWFHDGIDLAVQSGTPVRAAMAGTVIFAGPDGDGPPCGAYRGYGLGVVVDNGTGWQILYAHLAEINVAVGQTVVPDMVVGTVGQTGCVTGPHLHFGMRHGGQLVDPAQYLKQ